MATEEIEREELGSTIEFKQPGSDLVRVDLSALETENSAQVYRIAELIDSLAF